MQLYYTAINRLKQTLGSPTPWLFTLGVVALGLLVEGISKWIDAAVDEQALSPAVITIGIGILLLFLTIILFSTPQKLRHLFSQSSQPNIAFSENVPKRKGVIALVSKGIYPPAGHTLSYHGWAEGGLKPVLTHCWLLYGSEEDGELSSKANAEQLEKEFSAKNISVEIWPLADPHDIKEVFHAVQTIYQIAENKYHLLPDQIIADYTGGTKSMTVGMILAALEKDADLQYLEPRKTDSDGRADRSLGGIPRMVSVNFVDVQEQN